jgi:hypothetical protein
MVTFLSMIGVFCRAIFIGKQALIREISPYGQGPRFLIHDNDGIFGQFGSRRKHENGKKYRCAFDMWLDTTMGIKGIPIPYGAPNANARLERFGPATD